MKLGNRNSVGAWRLFAIIVTVAAMVFITAACASGGKQTATTGGETQKLTVLRVVAAWPLQSTQDYLYHEYIKALNEKAEQEGIPLKLETTGGPEVVTAAQMFEALRTGVIDVAYTAIGYYTGEVPEMGALDSISPAPEAYQKAVHEAKVKDKLNPIIEDKAQVHLLSLALVGRGFKLLSIVPVSGADWSGLKVRAIGTQSAMAIKEVGGSPVTIPATEVFTALQQGVVDAVIGTAMDRQGLGEHNVYKYITPSFAESVGGIFISKKVLDKLPDKTRAFLETASQEFEDWQYEWSKQTEDEAIQKYVKEEGVQMVKFSAEDQKRLAEEFRLGYLDYLVGQSPQYGPELKKLLEPYVW